MAANVAFEARSHRRFVAVVAAAVFVPVAVLMVRVVHSGWLSSSDWADIELRTRDVGTLHTPLVGVYSRYGWNHPGPLLFYVLALPYRLLGAQGHGILAGALVVNAAAIACVGVVAWRRGRLVGSMLGLAIVLVLARALGAGFLVDPWNPFVIVLPLLAVVCLAWAAADGDVWALPVAVGVGSFVVQSHAGAALAVIAPIGVAVIVLAIDVRRGRGARLKPVAFTTAAVAVVGWLPPVIQQFQSGGGNLGELIRFWTRSHDHTTGWSLGARIVGRQLAIPAPWFGGHERVAAFTGGVEPGWTVPFALILLIGAGVVAVRKRDRQSLTVGAMALAVVLAAAFSAAHIVDTPFDYIVRWMWAVGATVWLAILWTFWRALPPRFRPERAGAGVGAAVIAVLALTLTAGALHAEFPVQSDQRSIARVAPAVRRALANLRGPVLIDATGDFRSDLAADGVLLVAVHAGIDARLPRRYAIRVGTAHTISESSARSTVIVAVDAEIERYRAQPSYRELAGYDPLSPGERAFHTAVDREAARAYAAGAAAFERFAVAHRRDRARVHALDERGPRIALFLRKRD
jgi:hypothetical protein